MEYQYQIALMASPAYKELHQKYREIKEVQRRQKEEKLKVVVKAIQLLR
jgi:predicted HTH domain antitoxin